jgi:hypothetical protein
LSQVGTNSVNVLRSLFLHFSLYHMQVVVYRLPGRRLAVAFWKTDSIIIQCPLTVEIA